MVSKWAIGLFIALSPVLSNAQETDAKPDQPTEVDTQDIRLAG